MPWRNELSDLGPSDFTSDHFQKILQDNLDQVNSMWLKFEKHGDLIESALNDIEENGPPDTDAWAQLAPETVQANLNASVEGSIEDPEGQHLNPNNNIPAGNPSLEAPTAVYEVLSSRMSDQEWRIHIHSLNSEQTKVHEFFINWCNRVCQSRKHLHIQNPFMSL